jgi:3-hydroxyisobutyrate dehydrogenase
MGLATDIASASGSPLPLGEAAECIYEEVLKRQPELARKDFSSVYQYLHQAAQEGKKVHLGELVSM